MAPDLNSLPPSPSPQPSPLQPRMASANVPEPARSPGTSHTPPHSLAAAAAMNAGIHTEDSRRASSGSLRRDVERARRRSSIRMNLNLNDPAMPAPGEMQMSPSSRASRVPWPHSPQHERAPSLGELHQELEYEQEGQVNRLLTLIRQQQAQISALQANQPPQSGSAVDDATTPTSERSLSLAQPYPQQPPASIAQQRSRSPYQTISRQSSRAGRSRGNSHASSPAMRPMSSGIPHHESSEWLPSAATGGRDESAFYQAETQNLTRENQMLKNRIRELERQLADMNPTSTLTHSPAQASGLHATSSSTRPDTQAAPHDSEAPPPPS